MKRLVNNYTFDASAKTVTFNDYGSIELQRILMVTNATRGVIIFLFNDATLGGTVATNVLTLTYDTTLHADADKLQIFYDDPQLDNEVLVACAYDGSNNLEYFGRAKSGSSKASAVWQIRKLIYSGSNLVDIQAADGNLNYDNVWDNRASLSYS